MTNGNDYIEIEQDHAQQIAEDYAKDILEGNEQVPEDYVIKWIDCYREY